MESGIQSRIQDLRVNSSVLEMAQLFGETVRDVISRSTGLDIQMSRSAQLVPTIRLAEDIGSFVSFFGNYSGLMVMNFQGPAALEIVAASLRQMGMDEDEIPQHHEAEDVRNAIGELTNHCIGMARIAMQKRYDVSADASIPAVVPLTGLYRLELKAVMRQNDPCVRVVFTTPGHARFHMELCLEATQFVPINL